MDNRIIFSDNSTIIDYSTSLADYKSLSKTMDYVSTEDALYIGSKFPFNHLYFKVDASATNSQPSVVNVAVWGSNTFADAVDVIDETAVSGASIGQSGYITWTPNKQKSWSKDDTVKSDATEKIDGLGDITIYDRYWTKWTWSSDFTVTTAIQWIGNLFSDDDDLATEFPDLVRSNTLSGFETGKATWEEQHVRAAELIIDDLTNNKAILTKDQVLERREFIGASVFKVAEIIFNSYGDNGEKDKLAAKAEYSDRINKAVFTLDRNTNAREDREEYEQKAGVIRRR